MPVPSYPILAATAGFAGSLASVSAKFVMSDLPLFLTSQSVIPPLLCIVLFRGIFILSTILLNGVMWVFYVKALRMSGNSLQVHAINTSCNFLSSAAFGYLMFGDPITVSWFFGASLMLMGVILMNTGDTVLERSALTEETKKKN